MTTVTIGNLTITHDPEADAYYIYLKGDIPPKGVCGTDAHHSGIHVDLDHDLKPVGIELIPALFD